VFFLLPLFVAAMVPCTFVLADVEETVSKDALQNFLQSLEHMSEDKLAQILADDDVNQGDLQKALFEDLTQDASVLAAPQPAAAAPALSPAAVAMPSDISTLSLADLVARGQLQLSNEQTYVHNQVCFHTSPKATLLTSPQHPVVAGIRKIGHFLDTKVRGKKIETIATVAYIIYRQTVWLYQQYAQEQMVLYNKEIGQYKPSFAASLLGVATGFSSATTAHLDFVLRVTFCGIRLYIDARELWRRFQRMEFFLDPDAYILSVKYHLNRVQSMFSGNFYDSAHLSLIKRVVLTLVLPLSWAGMFSKLSPGAPLHHPIMKEALQRVTQTIATEVGFLGQKKFLQAVPAKKQKTLFEKSGGIIRERLFVDVAGWVAEYVHKRFIHDASLHSGAFWGRRLGQYAIRHVYLHILISFLRSVVRNGGLKIFGSIGIGCGWLLKAIGLSPDNLARSIPASLKQSCETSGILTPEQDLKEILVYPAAFFPGAFVRAVKRVITKQQVASVLAQEPYFLSHLSAMHGVGFYDVLKQLVFNPLIQQEMSQRIAIVHSAVSAVQWQRILGAFANELIIELLFDRSHILCQFITEPLLTGLSAPLLRRIEDAVLPAEKELVH